MSDSKAQIRAEKAAAKAHGKALRPWYKKKRFILPGILVLIIIIAAAGGGGGGDKTSSVAANSGGSAAAPAAPAETSSAAPAEESSSPAPVQAEAAGNAADDVVVNSCTAQSLKGFYEAEITITNSTDDAATYSVTISANGADGNRVGELNGFANAIAPGQSATVNAVGSVTGDAATCVVANASRF